MERRQRRTVGVVEVGVEPRTILDAIFIHKSGEGVFAARWLLAPA
jgi:hypothetical protein